MTSTIPAEVAVILYQPVFEIDWNDLNSLLVLSDAEEERGNLIAAEVLRWIVREKLIPADDYTYMFGCTNSSKTLTWIGSLCFSAYHPQLKDILHCIPDWNVDQQVYNQQSERRWRSYLTISEAYLALVTAFIQHPDLLSVIKGN